MNYFIGCWTSKDKFKEALSTKSDYEYGYKVRNCYKSKWLLIIQSAKVYKGAVISVASPLNLNMWAHIQNALTTILMR